MESYNLKDLRAMLKPLGYRAKTKTNSEFISAEIVSPNGDKLRGDFLSAEFMETHKAAFEIRAKVKGKIFEGLYRVIL